MTPLRRTLMCVLALFVASCDAPTTVGPNPELSDLETWPPALGVVSGVPEVCGQSANLSLMLGSNISTGSVEVANDESNLYVTYRSYDARWISATALFVGDSPDQIPTRRRGAPRIGRFPYRSGHSWRTNEVIWEIPLSDVSGETAVIAAFAQVGVAPSWAEGMPIRPDGHWAMYFTYEIAECDGGGIGSTGGIVSSSDGRASLDVPAGALTGPVDITIEPATIDDLLNHSGGQTAAPRPDPTPALTEGGPARSSVSTLSAEAGESGPASTAPRAVDPLPPVNGYVPIANTIWDLEPAGTQFDLPAILVLSYNDADLPAGVDESQLGAFVTNGIFEELSGVVDPVANTVTAQIEHFSFAFIAYLQPAMADVAVIGAAESDDPIELGEEVAYQAEFTNQGPDPATGGVVYYQGFGDVTAGTLDPACENVVPPLVAAVTIRCAVGDVGVGSTVTAPSAALVPGRTGTFTVWFDPAADEIDPDVTNNRFEATYDVVDPVADLSIQILIDTPDPAAVGEAITYSTFVAVDPSTRQAVEGATLFLSFSDATLVSASETACFETELGVTCPLPSLPSGIIHGVDVALAPADGLDQLQVNSRVEEPFGTTDPDGANNVAIETTAIGVAGNADLSVTDVAESADPIELGQEITYQATVRNFGPDPAPGTVVYYQGFGDVQAGTLNPSCENVVPPIIANVTIRCAVGDLAHNGISLAPAAAFLPGSVGSFTVWVDPGSDADDPNTDNNRFETTYDVVPLTADMQIQTIEDTPDPAGPGENITYYVFVAVDPGTQQTVEGATLMLNFGSASFVPAEGGACFGTLLGATCPLPPLAPGVIHPVVLEVAPDEGLSQLQVTATVQPPFGVLDPDGSNNAQVETTTIQVPTPPTADLRVDRIDDTPDPVDAGSDVTYEIDVVSMNADAPINGAVLQVLFTGTAHFESSTLTCSPIAGGMGCPLGTLQPGLVVTEQLTATLPTAGQVMAEARIVVPVSVNDPDPTNNSLSATTTVESVPPPVFAVGSVIEIPGPNQVSGQPPDTVWYSYSTAGDPRYLHLSRVSPIAGFGHVVVMNADTVVYPEFGEGRASERSSVNEVFYYPAGSYRVGITGATGPYRLGLGDGVGRPDMGFGGVGNGVYMGPTVSSSGDAVLDMALVGNETVTIGEFTLERFNATGTPDAGFGTGGVVDLPTVLSGYGTGMAVQPDGKIVVTAKNWASPHPWIVARFEANGTLDATFGTGGITTVNLGGNRNSATPVGVAFQQNGSDLDIVVAGDAGGQPERMGVARLNPDGSLDTGFGTGGIVFENQGFSPQRMGLQSDGGIVVVGFKEMARYTASGALDTSFGAGGVLNLSVPTNVQGIEVLPDDDILLMGEASGDAYINRINSDGTTDATFAGGGYATYDFGLADRFMAATQTAAGQLVVVGQQQTVSGDAEFLVTRMSQAGVIDGSFGLGGYTLNERVDRATTVEEDAQGRLVVGGHWVHSSVTRVELMRVLVN